MEGKFMGIFLVKNIRDLSEFISNIVPCDLSDEYASISLNNGLVPNWWHVGDILKPMFMIFLFWSDFFIEVGFYGYSWQHVSIVSNNDGLLPSTYLRRCHWDFQIQLCVVTYLLFVVIVHVRQ